MGASPCYRSGLSAFWTRRRSSQTACSPMCEPSEWTRTSSTSTPLTSTLHSCGCFGPLAGSEDYDDRCGSRIRSNWHTVRDRGLTEHENWWPRIYLQACDRWGIAPDPKVLGFAETYEGQRADLKTVGASG